MLQTAARRAGLGASGGVVSGLTGPVQALYVAAAARTAPAILVVPTDADVESMTADVGFFLAGFEGASEADVDRTVLAFPSHEVDPYRGLAPHFDVASARSRALHGLAVGRARVIVASVASLFPRMSAPDRLLAASVSLVPGSELSPVSLGDVLLDGGYRREDPVDEHGEYTVRGGVVDVFPAGEDRPVRIEFVGDAVESIRPYDPATQRSVASLDRVSLIPVVEIPGVEVDSGVAVDAEAANALGLRAAGAMAWLLDYVPPGVRPVVFVSELDLARRQGLALAEQLSASHAEAVAQGRVVPAPDVLCVDWSRIEGLLANATVLETLGLDDPDGVSPAAAPPRRIPSQPAVEFHGRIRDWVSEVARLREAGSTVVFAAATTGRAERCIEMLAEYGVPAGGVETGETAGPSAVLVVSGRLTRGFRLPTADLQFYTESDVFEEERRIRDRRRSVARTFLSDFRDLKPGDRVVHVDHGIGRFVSLKRIEVGEDPQEFVELRYADENKLFVPVERLDLIQKYSGASDAPLDRLGGATWERAKTRVRRAMRDMAEELLKLYAARKAIAGHAFGPDSHWQREFEEAFEYDLTADQETAIDDIRTDLEATFPMDRLLCGDVGYGKTEVAMRAAFKAVMDGKQVTFLAPTTVLALQHHKTLQERFAAFPLRIEMISRFRSRAEQKDILADLASGKIEIIVGTHRLLSKDITFRDLGLLIVDEEQRFGVVHKERLKQLRKRVDVLTMTATPIPRTLNMSLVGIRDMSVIETPPRDRLSIQTSVVSFDTAVVARAIRNELERGGQVYFVHNRVQSIYSVGDLLRRLVPEGRIAVAHGQMNEVELEKVMVEFVDRRHDVLLATTIIENGLDIPNANTIIVNRADRYGLAQLYQLRGRVGRSDRRAYAFLLIPPEHSLSAVARKRLAAIREFSDLGSGFRIAALDLEIRGAGNLLGGEQSGHIDAIGFEMYMKLLEQTIQELKGEEVDDELRAAVNLQVDLRIDEAYIPNMNQRLAVYRRIAGARDAGAVDSIMAEVRDRYGEAPPSMLNLLEYGRIRTLADRLRVESLDRQGGHVVLTFRPNTRVDLARLLTLVSEREDLSLSPPSIVKLRLAGASGRPAASVRRPAAARRSARRGSSRPAGSTPSWWTARAAAGSEREGFSKESILKPVPEDPLAAGGVFERTRQLLTELSQVAEMS